MLKVLTTITCLLIVLYNYRNKRLLSSSSIWVFCYLLIMVINPIYYSEIIYINEDFIDVVALGGSIFFFIGCVLGNQVRIKTRTKQDSNYYIVPDFYISCIAFWITFLLSIATLIYLLGSEGIRSILLGIYTSKQFSLYSDESNSLYVFSVHLMVPCILAMWITAEKKNEKRFRVFALLIYIVETILFGFTRIFMISILAIILIYEMRYLPQRKQVLYSFIGVAILTAILVLMNFIRSLGLGRIEDLNTYVNLDYIFESTDFSASYYWFDRLLTIDPPYINPIVYLKPFFMVIPRSIWETKPVPLSLQILKIVDPALIASGYSTAGNSVLGEAYAVLGYFGFFIFPVIWGVICGLLDRNYYKRLWNGADKNLKNIFYYVFAVFIVISGQRGDWCQYMGTVLWFYFLPLYLLSKFSLRRKRQKVGSI